MTALKKNDCRQRLRDQCKHIAETISTPLEDVHEWMNDVYDIEWITFNDHKYKAARLMVAGGGPTIWVNTMTDNVEGYWGTDRVKHGFSDHIGLNDYLLEMHANETAVLTS